jgi:hypothetical protein
MWMGIAGIEVWGEMRRDMEGMSVGEVVVGRIVKG